MPLIVRDRVKQFSTTAGTGTLTLGSTPSGFQSFAVIGDGNTTFYTIVNGSTGDFEVGIGTYTDANTTLSRDTVLSSSNSNTLVNFNSDSKEVFVVYSAEKAVFTDVPQALTNKTLNLASNTLVATSAQIAAAVTDETGTGALVFANSPSLVNPSYTGTLTGGTGVVNLGSGQLFKDASGNVGIGTSSPSSALQVQGLITGTAVTQSNTDTTAGRLTKVGDFGLGTDAIPTEQVDLNDAMIAGGTRLLVTGTSASNFPPGFSTVNFVFNLPRLSGSRASQLAIESPALGSNRMALRGFGTSGYTPWAEFYSNQNILGTVSQSGGVPTGAIIERGSNANGEFVKYADGTMICWVKATLVDHTGSFSSSTRLTGTFTYAASFVDASKSVVQLNIPVHTAASFIGCNRLDVVCWGTSVGGTTSTETSVFFTGGVSTSNARIENMQATAIGRWF